MQDSNSKIEAVLNDTQKQQFEQMLAAAPLAPAQSPGPGSVSTASVIKTDAGVNCKTCFQRESPGLRTGTWACCLDERNAAKARSAAKPRCAASPGLSSEPAPLLAAH